MFVNSLSRKQSNAIWLFDLDNTLHNASHAIFPLINQTMTQVIAEYLHISIESANLFRILYWQKYGATLLGMVKHHQINAQQFLLDSHPLSDILPNLAYHHGVRHALEHLPGKKLLLTNSPKHYAIALLRAMRLYAHFDDVISIEDCFYLGQYRPKPSNIMLKRVLQNNKIAADRTILVDDTLINLKVAHQLGLKTVWVTQWAGTTDQQLHKPCAKPYYVTHKVHNILQLGRIKI